MDATLPHGLMPLVVPQLRTITLGGAVTGLGIESTSFRNGLPHESVLEMDVLTGSGDLVTTKPGDPFFDSFPNSYGSLGYATRLRIELEPVQPFVALRHVPFADAATLAGATAADREPRAPGTACRVDGLDGVAFSPGELYLTLATWTDEPGPDLRLHRRRDLLPFPATAPDRPAERPTTTCGGGTPTGSGARAPSGCTPRGCGGCGHGAGGAATSTTGWSGSTAGSATAHAATGAQGCSGSGSSRTSRCRWTGSPSSSRGSTRRSACGRCGCAPSGCGSPPVLAARGRGRRTPSLPAPPTSTPASGGRSRCRPAAPRATSTVPSRQKVTDLGGHKSLYSDAYYDETDVRCALRHRRARPAARRDRPRRTTEHALRQGGESTMTTTRPPEDLGRGSAGADAPAWAPAAPRGLRRQHRREPRRSGAAASCTTSAGSPTSSPPPATSASRGPTCAGDLEPAGCRTPATPTRR